MEETCLPKELYVNDNYYYFVKGEEDYRSILKHHTFDENSEDAEFSDAIKEHEKIREKYTGNGLYSVWHFCNNPCDFGFILKKVDPLTLNYLINEINEFLENR